MAQFIDGGLPPPTACMSAAMMGRSCEHIWPPTPASARGHTQDGNQHGTENIFLFSGSPLRTRTVCRTLIHPSVRHQSKSSLASGPDIRGMSATAAGGMQQNADTRLELQTKVREEYAKFYNSVVKSHHKFMLASYMKQIA